MILTEEKANAIFDIIVKNGNFSSSFLGEHRDAYIAHKKEEFVKKITTQGLNEYWFPTEHSSHITLYFDPTSETNVDIYAPYVSSKERHIIAEMEAAFRRLSV